MSTQPEYESRSGQEEISGWAVGGIVFAGTVMVMIGVFQAIAGLVAIIDDEFYVVTRNYTFDIDTSAWGWIHLIVGILVAGCGWALFARKTWAVVATIMLASLSAVVNFFFIPYYPFWSILVIALDVWVIWSVTRPGVIKP
jgi:hypothetical protein